MNGKKIIFMPIIIILTICFAIIAFLVVTNRISWFDVPLIYFIQGMESSALTKLMTFFTLLGSKYIVILISLAILLLLYKLKRQLSELLLFAIVSLGSEFLNIILKIIFQRTRPVEHRLIEESGYSFPSGHSMAAFTLFVLIAILFYQNFTARSVRLFIILFTSFLIIAIGLSRIYLGVHFPSDILGGYLVSAIWVYFSYNFIKKTIV